MNRRGEHVIGRLRRVGLVIGADLPPSRSLAICASTSFMFMFVEVPIRLEHVDRELVKMAPGCHFFSRVDKRRRDIGPIFPSPRSPWQLLV